MFIDYINAKQVIPHLETKYAKPISFACPQRSHAVINRTVSDGLHDTAQIIKVE